MQATQIKDLIEELTKTLRGEWVLIGGALLHYLDLTDRQTLDIDLAPVGRVNNEITLKALAVAEKMGLPPETINFAAEYFLKKQKNWKSELILIKKAKTCSLYRPSKRLFRQLKEARGTETDLLDIKIFEEGLKSSR